MSNLLILNRLRKFSFARNIPQFFLRSIFSNTGVLDSELTNEVKKEIELHWKEKINVYPEKEDAEKFYLLSMFPYPSGNLHMGHVRVYTISDALARFFRMNGKKVIHPIGWDAFGLPAENAAIERNILPSEWTIKNIETMKTQLKDFNISFDWDRELATCNPSYYKWTQFLFLLMFEHGLAYKKQALVNWDPVDQTVLADEQVDENGCSWRSGCKVEKRKLSQWFLRTSEFSKDLFDGLQDTILVEWRDAIKIQKHWIGEPNGVIFHLDVCHKKQVLKNALTVWTNTPELIFGASFIGISPNNHFNAPEYGSNFSSQDQQLDITVKHPFIKEQLPVFVTESIEHSSATDSCLGIPVAGNPDHLSFAAKHKLKIVDILDNSSRLKNSGEFSGLNRDVVKKDIIEAAKKLGVKVYQASNKLRDWLISRQRYWGTPIPIINCPTCKTVPVPKEDLPVLLPSIAGFTGKSCSLKNAENWIQISCPKCGEPATRETDTMDTFVDSSWYFLRYLDVENETEPYNVNKIKDLMPVDLYIGGKEHASMHLFYARFMCHFLHSINYLKYTEPFSQLLMQGMVMGKSYCLKDTGKYITKEEVDFSGKMLVEKSSGLPVIEDWEKMSKSKYNGIDPQTVIAEHGIDTTRLFILGNVAPQSPRKWNDELFPGIKNFQWRLWLTVSDFIYQRKLNNLHQTLSAEEIKNFEHKLSDARNFYIKKVTHNYLTTRQLSVAISKLQGLTGELRRIPKEMSQSDQFENALADLLIMMAPLAPHFISELWTAFCSANNLKSTSYNSSLPVLHQSWPKFDENCPMEIVIKLNSEDFDSIPISRLDLLQLTADEAIKMSLNKQTVIETLNGAKVRNSHYKVWPNYDPEVNIIFIPVGGKKVKKQKKNKAKES